MTVEGCSRARASALPTGSARLRATVAACAHAQSWAQGVHALGAQAQAKCQYMCLCTQSWVNMRTSRLGQRIKMCSHNKARGAQARALCAGRCTHGYTAQHRAPCPRSEAQGAHISCAHMSICCTGVCTLRL